MPNKLGERWDTSFISNELQNKVPVAKEAKRIVSQALVVKTKAISLGKRWQKAFGYAPANESNVLQKKEFSKNSGSGEASVFKSGSTTLDVVTFQLPAGDIIFGDMLNAIDGLKVFAPPLMITYDKAKKIIETEIDGGDSVVVERYNSGQWTLKLQGLLIDMEDHQFPLQQLELLNKMFEIDGIIPVVSEVFSALKIKSVYLTDVNIATLQGFEDTVSFSLTAKSIKPVEYFLKNIEK